MARADVLPCSVLFAAIIFFGSESLAQKTPAPKKPEPVDYNREVRPILSANCFACHGPDDKKRKAEVRIDVRDAATRVSTSGDTPIVPGRPEDSSVIERVFSKDADQIMPPPASHKTLKASDKETLKRWIAEGAEYRPHWAFVKPIRPAVPTVRDKGWVRNEVDAFVLNRLEKQGLKPSAEADRSTLIRRLSLDLTGLPPTIAEVDAFLADRSPNAYEAVVNRLLASPHYGERWARRWLDRARYADTNGYEKDRDRSIWPYRDWVIRALNADMPFDRFTVEQLAGDLLPGSTESQKVATGFHRNTMINEEGGIDVEEFRWASLVDRVATTGSVWLGMTIQCAQCHTHKYDPITQKEYYEFLAFFNNADEPDLDLFSQETARRRAEIEAKAKGLESQLESQFPGRKNQDEWVVLTPTSASATSGANWALQTDASLLASGPTPEVDTYTITAETALSEIDAIRLEILPDRSLPHKGPGRAPNGNFVLRNFKVVASPLDDSKSMPVNFVAAESDIAQQGFPVQGAIDADPATGWAIDDGSPGRHKAHSAAFGVGHAIGFEGGTRLSFTLDQNYGGKHVLGRFRLSARKATPNPSPIERRQYLASRVAEWERSLSPVPWQMLTPSRVTSMKHATMTVLEDRSVLAMGDKPNNDTYEVEIPSDQEGITGLRLEVLPDPSLPENGPGRAPLFSVGDFFLTELDVAMKPAASSSDWQPLKLAGASEDYTAPGRSAAMAIDGLTDTGWSIAGGVGRAHAAVFRFSKPVGGRGLRLKITLHQEGIHQTTIGRFRISATTDTGTVKASGVPADVEEILLVEASQRSGPQVRRVREYFLSIAPELAAQHKVIADLRRSQPHYETSMVMQERRPEDARVTHLRHRGEFLQPAEAVSPGVPATLPGLASGGSRDRLALAQWLVNGENPLVGRVAMNQAWQAFFGRGLMATVEDFGVRGDEPSHPELLDWLATEFPRRGWSMKQMHRLIATSATYRQSSRTSPESLAIDPTNTLLSRGPRFRVEAEVVRDIALSASGLLNPAIGGPSVYPPQPEGATTLAYGQAGWPTSTGPSRYRRGLYTFLKRTAPYASFLTFDAPTSETTCVRRDRSNTPLQALTLLNDAVFVEASQALALRVLSSNLSTFEDRSHLAFRLCLSRLPREDEVARLKRFYDGQKGRFQAKESDPYQVAGISPKTAGKVDPIELASWTAVARVLLNLDETITKE